MPTDLTRDGLINALSTSAKANSPFFLRDVLRMKRNRGDLDADQFKNVACHEYAHRLNATIDGAARAMRQWVGKAEKLGWTDEKVARCTAFLADLDAVIAGDRAGWDISTAEAA